VAERAPDDPSRWWVRATRRDVATPEQGWKLHVSVAPAAACRRPNGRAPPGDHWPAGRPRGGASVQVWVVPSTVIASSAAAEPSYVRTSGRVEGPGRGGRWRRGRVRRSAGGRLRERPETL
jgi:hypothetical protein